MTTETPTPAPIEAAISALEPFSLPIPDDVTDWETPIGDVFARFAQPTLGDLCAASTARAGLRSLASPATTPPKAGENMETE